MKLILNNLIILLLIIYYVYGKDLTYIDDRRLRYRSMESEFWHEIQSVVPDRNLCLQKLHTRFYKFLSGSFGDKNRIDNIYDERLSIYLRSINETLSVQLENQFEYLAGLNNNTYPDIQHITRYYKNFNMIEILDNLFVLINPEGFFVNVAKIRSGKCKFTNDPLIMSVNQILYEYYVDISAAFLKGYSMMQLKYMTLTLLNEGSHITESNALQQQYEERILILQDHVRREMTKANKDIWMCDLDRNYRTDEVRPFSEQITNFLQGYIDNEVNLNNEESCTSSCNDYRLTRNYACQPDTLCSKEPEFKCNGSIINCNFYSSSASVCKSTDFYSRRYDYIVFDNDKKVGINSTRKCRNSFQSQSWTRGFVQCQNCFCLCDDPSSGYSDRFFSLKDVVSNIQENMIVTGVAFTKRKRVIHLKISVRKLLKHGYVKVIEPAEWISQHFVIDDPNVKNGIDYYTLTWQNRSINLDTVTVPLGSVVTGVRFRIIADTITLQIRSTEFNFKTGQLNPNSNVWISNSANVYRQQIFIETPSNPYKFKTKSVPDTRTNTYLQFGPTDIDDDGSQTTVPFIDNQLVEPDIPVPLAGVGIYYKSQKYSGGFIAPKLIVYDFAPHIN